MSSFRVNDIVRFKESSLSARGILCKKSNDTGWIVKVIRSSMKLQMRLHDCDGYFTGPIGWFVDEEHMELKNGTYETLDEILGLYV